jgi:amino acid transporter
MADAKPSTGFQQRLGLFDATMLVAGSMIGSGIFIVSADISRDVGSSGWLLFVWVLTGIITIMGALSYAELAAMMPHAGGQYVYLRESYGPLWGFLYGWTCFLVIQTGFIAAVSVAFARFLGVFAPTLGTDHVLWAYPNVSPADAAAEPLIDLALPVPWLPREEWPEFFRRAQFTVSSGQIVAVVVTLFLTGINCLGVQAGKVVQNVFTVAKIAGLVALIALGLTVAVNTDVLQANFTKPWDGIWSTKTFATVRASFDWAPIAAAMVLGAAMVGSLFSSDAWNQVTYTAGEIKDPRRNLPWSLALGVTFVIALYLLANLAYLAALPLHQGSNELEILAKTAALRGEEERFALSEARIKHAEANIALAEQARLVAQAKLEKLERQGDAPMIHALRQTVDYRTRQIAVNEARVVSLKKEQVSYKRLVSQANGELTMARGIDHARDDRVGTAVLERASPGFGVPFMALAIMISTFGCVNGLVLMGPRLYYAMAQDRLFFQSVGRLNQRGVPAFGLVLQGLWSVLLIFSGTYSDLLDYIIFAALLFYVLTVAGLFVLRRTRPDAERPYKAFGYPLVPAVYVALCALIGIDLLIVKPRYSWPSFIIVLTGIPVFWIWRAKAPAKLVGNRSSAD